MSESKTPIEQLAASSHSEKDNMALAIALELIKADLTHGSKEMKLNDDNKLKQHLSFLGSYTRDIEKAMKK